jgi:hypothetical protein
MADNTVTTFAGFLRTKYAQNLVNTIPEDFVLQTDAPFVPAKQIGEQFQQAVITKMEQGGTYSRTGQGSFTLNATVAGAIEKAIVQSSQFVLKSGIDFETLSKALSKGEMAFGSAGDQLLKNMAMSSRKRLEIDLWAGQQGLGIVSAIASDVITFTDASWAPGYWVGMEGAVVEIFDTALTTQRTGTAAITAVDIANKKVTLASTPTGTAATDVVFFQTQRETAAHNSFLGLLPLANTSTGTLFNIDTAVRSIWKPNQVAVGGQISFSVLQDAMVSSVSKGLTRGGKTYVSLDGWTDLLTEQAALRRFGGDFDGRVELVNGGRAIKFHTMAGPMEIKPSLYCKFGNAVIVPDNALARVGSTDVTFKVPGMDEPLVLIGDTTAGVTLRSYYNQALYTNEPGQITLLTGITA